MFKIINSKIKELGIDVEKELSKLSSSDEVFVMMEDINSNVSVNINNSLFAALLNCKAKVTPRAYSGINDICFLCGKLIGSGCKVSDIDIIFDAAQKKAIEDTIARFMGETKPKQVRKPRVAKEEKKPENISKEPAPIKEAKAPEIKAVEKKPRKPRVTKATTTSATQMPKKFSTFIASCDDDDFKISEYCSQIYSACLSMAKGKGKLIDCLKIEIKSDAVVKAICQILAPKAKELSEALK